MGALIPGTGGGVHTALQDMAHWAAGASFTERHLGALIIGRAEDSLRFLEDR